MIDVTLPIFIHNESTQKMQDIEMDYDIDDCEEHPVTFFHISAICVHAENPKKNYTDIHANGTTYVCPLSVDQVHHKIMVSKNSNHFRL